MCLILTRYIMQTCKITLSKQQLDFGTRNEVSVESALICRFARVFAARTHKILLWMKIKTRTHLCFLYHHCKYHVLGIVVFTTKLMSISRVVSHGYYTIPIPITLGISDQYNVLLRYTIYACLCEYKNYSIKCD